MTSWAQHRTLSLSQVKYYVRQKDSPHDWKCQPNKWLSSKEELHEIIVGWFSVTLGSALSAALATWVVNGGYTSLYYTPGEYGLLWALLEGPIVFIVTVRSVQDNVGLTDTQLL